MKKAFFLVFCLFFSASVFSAPIPIAPGQTLLLKGESWAAAGSLPVVATSAGRLVPWIGYAITFGPVIYKGVEMLMADGIALRVPLTYPNPSLWTPLAPPAPPDVPLPSGLYTTSYNCTPPAVGTGNSAAAACDAFLGPLKVCDRNSQGYDRAISVLSSTETTCVMSFPGGYQQTFSTTKTPPQCPAGFGASASGCTSLYQQPETRDHIPDQKCDQGFANTDVDCAAYRPAGPMTFYGNDADGPYTVDITPGGSGSAKLRRRVQRPSPGGDTQVETDELEFDGDGKLVSGSHSTRPGTKLDLPTPTNPNPEPVPTDPTNPNPTTSQFPNDYAREQTAQQTATKLIEATQVLMDIKTKQAEESQKWDARFVDPAVSSPSDSSLTPKTGSETFKLIKDLVQIQPSNFSHISQCPTSSFSWNGQTYTINQHCPLINDHWTIFAAVMMAVWTALSLFIVLKA